MIGFSAGAFLAVDVALDPGADALAFIAPIYGGETGGAPIPLDAPPIFGAVARNDILVRIVEGLHAGLVSGRPVLRAPCLRPRRARVRDDPSGTPVGPLDRPVPGVAGRPAARGRVSDAVSTETVAALGRAMADGTTSSRQLARTHLARIERLDPLFGAIRCLVPDAVDQARPATSIAAGTGRAAPWRGSRSSSRTTSTSPVCPRRPERPRSACRSPRHDAPLIRHLREAGAVILAKANLSELANFLTDGMPSGYSSLGGQVLNPVRYRRSTPSGSSSGTGVRGGPGRWRPSGIGYGDRWLDHQPLRCARAWSASSPPTA